MPRRVRRLAAPARSHERRGCARGLARAVALTCAAAALTPGVATAAPPETRPCPPGTRAVTGTAGAGWTTSPSDGSDGVAELALILTGAGAFAIARDVRA